MYTFLAFATVVGWITYVLALIDNKLNYSKRTKIIWAICCLLITLVTVGVRIGQLAYTKDYRYYDLTKSGLCIKFQDLACKDIPFDLDDCRVIREEIKCIEQPTWWGKRIEPDKNQ